MEITDEMRRHSAAHLTARAVMNLFDNVQVDIGPATDEGFYYDFDLEHRLSPDDFPKIEAEVARIIALDEPFVQKDVTAEEAKKMADAYAKDTIDTIRTFNGYAEGHDFRAEGISAAAVTLSNPGATESSVTRDRRILQGVEITEAQNALRIYGKAKGWSRDTVNKRLRFLANRW